MLPQPAFSKTDHHHHQRVAIKECTATWSDFGANESELIFALWPIKDFLHGSGAVTPLCFALQCFCLLYVAFPHHSEFHNCYDIPDSKISRIRRMITTLKALTRCVYGFCFASHCFAELRALRGFVLVLICVALLCNASLGFAMHRFTCN